MNNQEAFDKVVKHLRAQKWVKSEDELDGCLYRCGTLKCAVGALIPDDQYSWRLELVTADQVMTKVPALVGLDPRLLRSLQSFHDQDNQMDPTKDDEYNLAFLELIALEYKLKWTHG